MGERTTKGVSRIGILLVVLASHVGLLMWFLRAHIAGSDVSVADEYVELVFVPPARPPSIRFANTHPERLSTNVAVGLAPPALVASAESGPSAEPEGHGAAVNWVAEARRAVRAYEIRRDQPVTAAQAVSSSFETRSPREHHAGDKYRTESGDWIVWISATCYQVASWHSDGLTTPPSQPETICPPDGRAPR